MEIASGASLFKICPNIEIGCQGSFCWIWGASRKKNYCLSPPPTRVSFISLVPASVTLEHAHYWVVWFQSQNSGYGVTRLCPFLLRIMCYVLLSTDGSGPPLSSLSKIPLHQAPCIQPIFPRVHLSLLLLPPRRPFVVYLNYHLQFDPKLGQGKCEIRHIPFVYNSYTHHSDFIWIPA